MKKGGGLQHECLQCRRIGFNDDQHFHFSFYEDHENLTHQKIIPQRVGDFHALVVGA